SSGSRRECFVNLRFLKWPRFSVRSDDVLDGAVATRYRMRTREMKTDFDVMVIGAGNNGAGIARDAALRVLKVLLVDKADVAGGTSAGSTRLIHGGLRYLEHFEFGLVRESLRERETLLRIVPHLV